MGLLGLDHRTLYLDVADAGLDDHTVMMLAAHVDEFESVLGCRVRMGQRAEDRDAVWVIRDPAPGGPASLTWDRATLTLTSCAEGPAQVVSTVQLLRALVRSRGGAQAVRAPSTPRESAAVIRDEVLGTYPYFDLRGIERDGWAAHAEAAPGSWEAFAPWAQEWVARLGDAHTAVIARSAGDCHPPYSGFLTSEGIVLEAVPSRSAAHEAGVRTGWMVDVPNPGFWLGTTGASPQQHGPVAARRTLCMPAGEHREFVARHPVTGHSVYWDEVATRPTLADILTVSRQKDDVVRVKVSAFRAGLGLENAFDEICGGAEPSQVMELDLRGNTGGNLLLALGLQRRFLRRPTHTGSISHSDGCGGFGAPREMWAEPGISPRWPGRVRILIDSMTYSAAEDFVLGLQGLDHVTVAGERTGGGSGRPLTRLLGPDLMLRVSTALTYDRQGRAVEFHGIEPDEY